MNSAVNKSNAKMGPQEQSADLFPEDIEIGRNGIAVVEFDSSEDDAQVDGQENRESNHYQLISQNAEYPDSDAQDQDEQEASHRPQSQQPASSSLNDEELNERIQLWTSPRERNAPVDEDPIPLNDERIEQVKSAMSSIQLPASAVPSWARGLSESEFNERLLQRIRDSK